MSEAHDSYVESWVNTFATVPEILAEPEEEAEWIVRGLLRRGTYMIVYGWQTSGKSSILYQLATKLHDGGSWFGFDVEDRGNVLFLQVDMGPKESRGLLKRAERESIHTYENIFFPRDYGVLDALTPEGEEALRALAARYNPRIVIIDTATDAFEAKPEHGKDVNAPIRAAIRVFRLAFPDAGLIFVLHERRPSPALQAKGIEDEDPVLGGGEWERKCSGSIRLKRINETSVRLIVKKTRDVVPFKEISLLRTANGFFEINTNLLTPVQALALWPREGDDLPEEWTISNVCRSVERSSGGRLTFDALRKAYHRAKAENVTFRWEEIDGTF